MWVLSHPIEREMLALSISLLMKHIWLLLKGRGIDMIKMTF